MIRHNNYVDNIARIGQLDSTTEHIGAIRQVLIAIDYPESTQQLPDIIVCVSQQRYAQLL